MSQLCQQGLVSVTLLQSQQCSQGSTPSKYKLYFLQRTCVSVRLSMCVCVCVFKCVCVCVCETACSSHMSVGSSTSMYLIFIKRGKSISSFTSQSLRTSTDESRGFNWALTNKDEGEEGGGEEAGGRKKRGEGEGEESGQEKIVW